MKAQVYKANAWRDLPRLIGTAPEVVLEVETERLFQFVAPYVNLSIYDHGGLYRPDGSLELQRGDEVRIYSGDDDSVLIFSGVLDREFDWVAREGSLSFRALGWGAMLKDIILGQVQYESGNVIPNPVGDRATGDHLYRWVRRFTTGNVEYEEVVWNYSYELLAEGRQLLYQKVYRFNSLSYPPFALEIDQPAIWSWNTADGIGIWRRVVSKGRLKNYTIDEILDNIMQNIVEWGLTDSNYGIAEGTLSPGEIISTSSMRLWDAIFISHDYFTREIDGTVRVFAAGWGEDTSDENDPNPVLTIFEIDSDVMPVQLSEVNFTKTRQGAIDFRKSLTGRDVQDGWILHNNEIRHLRRRLYTGTDRVIYYQMWSWCDKRALGLVDGIMTYQYQPAAIGEWITLDLRTGITTDPIWDFYPQQPSVASIIDSATYYLSMQLDSDQNYIVLADRRVDPQRNPLATMGFLTSDGDGLSNDLSINRLYYHVREGLLYLTLEAGISAIAFELEDMTAVDMLAEICKLTNSIFWVDNDKQLNILNRTAFNIEHVISDEILSYALQITDHWGDDLPQIDSRIITNESYVTALNDYYRNTYFAEKEEVWQLLCLNTTAICNIKLLDAIRFPAIGLSDDVLPVIVRQITIRENEIEIKATRARAA